MTECNSLFLQLMIYLPSRHQYVKMGSGHFSPGLFPLVKYPPTCTGDYTRGSLRECRTDRRTDNIAIVCTSLCNSTARKKMNCKRNAIATNYDICVLLMAYCCVTALSVWGNFAWFVLDNNSLSQFGRRNNREPSARSMRKRTRLRAGSKCPVRHWHIHAP